MFASFVTYAPGVKGAAGFFADIFSPSPVQFWLPKTPFYCGSAPVGALLRYICGVPVIMAGGDRVGTNTKL